jgi:diacylglycerol kinase family enzyme
VTSIPIVLNPAAGGGRLLGQRLPLDTAAHRVGIRLDWWLTEGPGHGEHLGRRAAQESRPLVLAFGGDGTYNEVARGVVASRTALGILPGGTTSVLAYEFGVPRPAPRALAALLGGRDRPMRVCRTGGGGLVLLMLSAGPDALVIRDVPDGFKRFGGRVGVAAQAVRELVSRRPMPRIRVTVDGEEIEGGWAILGNSRCYAGRHHATPGADPFTEGFEVVVHRGVGRRAAASFALGIPLGLHVRRRDVDRRHGRRALIEPVKGSADVPYQIDGDPIGNLPVEMWSTDEELLVRLPSKSP